MTSAQLRMQVLCTVVSCIFRVSRAAAAETCAGMRCACFFFLPDIHATARTPFMHACALHRSCCVRCMSGGMRLMGWKLAHAREIKTRIV